MLVQWQGEAGVAALMPWDALLQAHYASRLDRGLLLLPGVFVEPMRRRVWLAVHPRTAGEPLVRLMVGAVRAAFEERRAWFEGL